MQELATIPDKKKLMRVANQKLPKYLHPDQIRMIINEAQKKRYKVLFSLLWQSGVRISEALNLRAGDIDWSMKQIRFITLKQHSGAKAERFIPMKPELIGELSTYLHEEGLTDQDKLFSMTPQAVHSELKSIVDKVGLPHWIHIHTFRHSFAINCLVQGVTINVLQEMLGHANIENTMIYLKVFQPAIADQFNKVSF